jgi:hypothetical protein
LGTISSSALPGRQSNRTTMGSVELVSYKFFVIEKCAYVYFSFALVSTKYSLHAGNVRIPRIPRQL